MAVSTGLDQLKEAAGPDGWSEDAELLAPRLAEWRGRWTGRTPLLLRPRSTAEVAAVVAAAHRTRTPLTLRGGGTGLVGGQVPDGEVLLSLERMAAVREVCACGHVIVVEAGATLQAVQDVAAAVNRSFPVGLASGGSATIGGMVATNAGGTAVLRYGSMREQVLGLEAVLADGSVWNGLSRLRKDNTGYDLRGLLIGAEGTLGVVTAAALRLRPQLASRAAAFAGVASPEAALGLLNRVQAVAGGQVEAFELISGAGLDLALRHLPGARSPLTAEHPWLVLVEVACACAGEAEALLQAALEFALSEDLIADAAVAASEAQRHDFWALREGQSAAQKAEGPAWKHDISVPVAAVPEFLHRAGQAMERLSPGARVVAFGHVGDGNIHYDVLAPPGADPVAHMDRAGEAMRAVHDVVHALSGSISAEHGLGVMKTTEALRYKDPVAVAMMRAIRTALDPHRILNPRVLF